MFVRELGKFVDDIDLKDIQALVEAHALESEVLEFKSRLPERDAKGYLEFSKDIAALANAHGGVILFGVKEKGDAADALVPVDVGPALEAPLKAATQYIMPLSYGLRWKILRTEDEGKGVAILIVPPSSLAPHAVMQNELLVYVRRVGRRRTQMSEADVEAAYRVRWAHRQSAEARLEALLGEARTACRAAGLCLAATALDHRGPAYGLPEEGRDRMERLRSNSVSWAAPGINRSVLGMVARQRFDAIECGAWDARDGYFDEAETHKLDWWARLERSGGLACAYPALRVDAHAGPEANAVRPQFGDAGRWLTEYQLETGVISCLTAFRELSREFEISGRFLVKFGCLSGQPLALVLPGKGSRVLGVVRRDALCEREISDAQLESRGGFLRIAHEVTLDLYSAFSWQPARTLVELEPGNNVGINLSKYSDHTLRSWIEKKGLL